MQAKERKVRNWIASLGDTPRNTQPLDLAGKIQTDRIRVPAPRLELQSGSLNDLRSILCELAKNAQLEMKRGNKGAVEELLQVFIESGEKFSTFEKKCVENDRGLQPFAGHSKGLPFVAEGS